MLTEERLVLGYPVDVVRRGSEAVLVMELKAVKGEDDSEGVAEKAVARIRDQGYAEPYRADDESGRRAVWLIGMCFDCDTHNISAWKAERL